jgi:hypothetical protein
MPQETINILKKAEQACLNDKFRSKNLIHLPDDGELIACGDLHGHKRNFERIKTFADLENNPKRHVVIQEIIHGGTEDTNGNCLSYQLLLLAAEYKADFPHRVHLITGNHDTAFITNSDVLKAGKEMNQSMRQALKLRYEERTQDVINAMRNMLMSQPLAVKCDNGLWLSHSLPANRFVDKFKPDIFERQLTESDFAKPGSVYLLTWGRRQNQETLDKLAEMFTVKTFLLGHQPSPDGWKYLGDNAVIITSEHNQGCIAKIDLSETPSPEKIANCIIKLPSLK